MKKNNTEKKMECAFKNMNSQAKILSSKKAIVIMTTTQTDFKNIKIFPLRIVNDFICLPIAIQKISDAKKIVNYFDSKIEAFFVDVENKMIGCENILQKIFPLIKKAKIFQIKSNDLTAEYTFALLSNFYVPLSSKKILILGSGNIGSKVALKLVESGSKIFIKNSTTSSTKKVAGAINILKPKECSNKVMPIIEKIPNVDCVISFTRGNLVIDTKILKIVKRGGLIIDGGTGTISKEARIIANNQGLTVMRLDIRKGFEFHTKLIMETGIFLSESYGFKKCENFKIISGGYIGDLGDVIVDNIKKPKNILGISDGNGKLLENYQDYSKNLEIANQHIKQN